MPRKNRTWLDKIDPAKLEDAALERYIQLVVRRANARERYAEKLVKEGKPMTKKEFIEMVKKHGEDQRNGIA